MALSCPAPAPSQSLLLAAVSTTSVPPPSASMRVSLITRADNSPWPLIPRRPPLVIVAPRSSPPARPTVPVTLVFHGLVTLRMPSDVGGAEVSHADDRPRDVQDAVVGPQVGGGKIDCCADRAEPVQGLATVGRQNADALNRAAGDRVGTGGIVAAVEAKWLARRVDVDDARRSDIEPGVRAAVAVVVDRTVHVDVGTGQVGVDGRVAVVGDGTRGIDRPAAAAGDVDGQLGGVGDGHAASNPSLASSIELALIVRLALTVMGHRRGRPSPR